MNKTKWTGQECPPNYTVKHNAGQLQLTLYTDIKEETTSDGVKQWTATQITLPVGVTDYGSIVSAIINSHYTNDQMQSIMNNYIDATDSRALWESIVNGGVIGTLTRMFTAIRTWLKNMDSNVIGKYAEMQQWRAQAKVLAQQIVDELNNGGGE
jgi:uncharacterized protein YejL (UPF0352 family)